MCETKFSFKCHLNLSDVDATGPYSDLLVGQNYQQYGHYVLKYIIFCTRFRGGRQTNISNRAPLKLVTLVEKLRAQVEKNVNSLHEQTSFMCPR